MVKKPNFSMILLFKKAKIRITGGASLFFFKAKINNFPALGIIIIGTKFYR